MTARKGIVAVLLILAASPVTAPFQTCDASIVRANDVVLAEGSAAANGMNPGSLVPTLDPQPGRSSFAADCDLIGARDEIPPSASRLLPWTITSTWSPRHDSPLRTVLRL